jgi:acyl-CoA synthetase (AMP-forming)/AMP-acid ligase II
VSVTQLVATGTWGEMLRETAARTPDREALVFPEERQTYAELVGRGEQRARELQALGVGPGDRFGLLLPSSSSSAARSSARPRFRSTCASSSSRSAT